MLMCSRCHQRPAVVFISQMNPNKPEEKKNEGLCLVCAKDLGLPQVDDYIKSMGISEDELNAMSEQLAEVPDGDDFELGGSSTMPDFLTSLFGEMGKAGGLLNNLAGELSKSAEQAAEAAKDGAKSVKEDKKDKKKKLKFLDNYCTNLTQRARDGELDRIIGRDKEISRVIHILSRRQKNNPCLIGEPGVGKTAVAEGIAQKIVAGDVPFHLQDKEVYLLDLTALVAGTQFRGQFESRCKGLVEEVKKQGNIILFIDEVHSLVGTGDSEGTMNAANILTGSPVRYFFARKSPAFCSRAGWLQRFVCKASLRGESPFKFHSLSGSCSNSARRLPRGRVTSQRTSASPSPWSRKRISCSSPTRIRSFIFCLSSVRTKIIRSYTGSCLTNSKSI